MSTKDGTKSEATKYRSRDISTSSQSSSPAEPLSQAEEPTSDDATAPHTEAKPSVSSPDDPAPDDTTPAK